MIPDLEGSGEKKVVDVLDKKKKKWQQRKQPYLAANAEGFEWI